MPCEGFTPRVCSALAGARGRKPAALMRRKAKQRRTRDMISIQWAMTKAVAEGKFPPAPLVAPPTDWAQFHPSVSGRKT
jgi:hypothetical protein